uniref:Uncharacterized protein n=1 Tax=Ixodes ricinus TaxID=34613 RepID=A0A6B0UQS7_IXORI
MQYYQLLVAVNHQLLVLAVGEELQHLFLGNTADDSVRLTLGIEQPEQIHQRLHKEAAHALHLLASALCCLEDHVHVSHGVGHLAVHLAEARAVLQQGRPLHEGEPVRPLQALAQGATEVVDQFPCLLEE